MKSNLASQWQSQFFEILQDSAYATPLQQAGAQKRLGDWTSALTTVVVKTCEALGWQASAKGYPLDLIPIDTQEYLNLDVTAFATHRLWSFPVAVMELENQQGRTPYSLWKVLCVRTALRIVFCYCETSEERVTLVRELHQEILQRINPRDRLEIRGETLIAVGSREDIQTFPYGYFKWWQLDQNTGTFLLINH